jgi:GMP synthase (glutamine-hydrolysing)
MKTLIVAHENIVDPGSLYDTLEERNADIDIHMGYEDTVGDVDPHAHDLAIFMGAPFGVYERERFPYIDGEVRYLSKRIEADRPTLGICLGAQLIAAAAGEKVYKGTAGPEIGWQDMHVNEAGMKTPLRHLDATKTKIMQSHGDTFDLPKEATLLASSEKYPHQAYSLGKRTMALQCHPEVTRTIMEIWFLSGADKYEQQYKPLPDFRADNGKYLDGLKKQTAAFFNEWLDTVL